MGQQVIWFQEQLVPDLRSGDAVQRIVRTFGSSDGEEDEDEEESEHAAVMSEWRAGTEARGALEASF